MFGPRYRARRAGAPATLCAWAVTELRPRSAFSYDLGDFLRSRWRHLNTMAASAPASARPHDRLTRRALRARRSRGYLHLCYAGPPCRATLRAGTFDVGMARREEQSAPQSRRGKSTVRHAWSSTSVTKLQLESSSFPLSPMTRPLDQPPVHDWPSGTARPAPARPGEVRRWLLEEPSADLACRETEHLLIDLDRNTTCPVENDAMHAIRPAPPPPRPARI